MVVAALLLGLSGPAPAADYGSPSTSKDYGSPYAWYPGGRHWRGHHDLYWRYRDPNFSYFTYGWGQPWYYSPRGWRPAHPYVGPNPPPEAGYR